MKAQITIDPRLIPTMGRSLYSGNPAVVAVRELLQNSWDACIAKGVKPDIHITIDRADKYASIETVTVTCRDNGIGMTEKQLLNDYLRLGTTGKKDMKSTGGFGIANAVVFSNEKWHVHTLDHYACPDENMEIDIEHTGEHLDGTEVTLEIKVDFFVSQLREAMRMIYFSAVDVKFTYTEDGELKYEDEHAGFSKLVSRIVDQEFKEDKLASLHKVRLMDDVEIYDFHTNGYDIIRLNGLVQFLSFQTSKRLTNLIFDIVTIYRPTEKHYPFTLSRESVQDSTAALISSISKKHTTDMLSSYRELEKPRVSTQRIVNGYMLKGKRGRSLDELVEGLAEPVRLRSGEIITISAEQMYIGKDGEGKIVLEDGREISIVPPSDSPQGKTHSDRYYDPGTSVEFINIAKIVKDLKELPGEKPEFYKSIAVIQDNYKKDPATVKAHARVLRAWREILEITASFEEKFGIGITSQSWINGRRIIQNSQVFYVVNPNCVLNIDTPGGRILRLWNLACHECAHAKHDIHDEAFSSEMGKISGETADQFWANFTRIKKLL